MAMIGTIFVIMVGVYLYTFNKDFKSDDLAVLSIAAAVLAVALIVFSLL